MGVGLTPPSSMPSSPGRMLVGSIVVVGGYLAIRALDSAVVAHVVIAVAIGVFVGGAIRTARMRQ